MDYGKIAYLKVDELENRIAVSTKSNRVLCGSYTVNPIFDFRRGDCFISELRAKGGVTVFVRAFVRADESLSDAELSVKINGLKAGSVRFSAAEGEVSDCFVMCAAMIDGTAVLSVGADKQNCTLVSCQIVVNGADADLARTGGDAAADKCGDLWALVFSRDDNVYACLFTEPDFSAANPVYIATGSRCDVTATQDGFAVAYVDVAGNTFVVFTDTSLNVTSRLFVNCGAEAVAIVRYRDGFALSELVEGKAQCRYVTKNSCSQPFQVDVGAKVEGISFVKNALPPVLVISTEERNLIKSCETEYGGSDKINVSADVVYTAVTV